MNAVDQLTTQKAALALKDLEQAWAYFTPMPLPVARNEEPVQGYAPYYQAA